MSYHGNLSDAREAIHSVESSHDIGHSKGKPSSKAGKGHTSPGPSNTPAGETQHVGRLRQGVKTPKTRTGTLTRKYGASK